MHRQFSLLALLIVLALSAGLPSRLVPTLKNRLPPRSLAAWNPTEPDFPKGANGGMALPSLT